MNKNFIKKVAIGTGLSLTLLPLLALAQGGLPTAPILTSPSQISDLIRAILGWISGIILTVALIMLLYAAFLYMTAGASEAALGKSKTVLIYAVVGIAVAILAYSFTPFIEAFLKRSGF